MYQKDESGDTKAVRSFDQVCDTGNSDRIYEESQSKHERHMHAGSITSIKKSHVGSNV